MSIRLNGSNTGSIEIDVPANAGTDTAIEIPAISGGQFIVSDSAGDVNIDNGTLFVDASTNRVGIGSTSPNYNLSVKGASDSLMEVQSSSNNRIIFEANSAGNNRIYARNGANGNGTLEFRTGTTQETMRIDGSGNVGIGATSFTSTSAGRQILELNGSASTLINLGAGGSRRAYLYTDSSDCYFVNTQGGTLYLGTSNTTQFSINSSGYVFIDNMAVGGTANVHWSSSNNQLFVTSSSERFKHDITAYDKGLTELMQLEPKYFTYNDEPGQKQRAGFIAEDFHALGLTEYVEYWNDEDGNATVPSEIGYSNMVAILVKSIQEQQAMIETLKTKVAALEGGTTE